MYWSSHVEHDFVRLDEWMCVQVRTRKNDSTSKVGKARTNNKEDKNNKPNNEETIKENKLDKKNKMTEEMDMEEKNPQVEMDEMDTMDQEVADMIDDPVQLSLAQKTGRLGMLVHRYYTAGARRHGKGGNPLRGQGRVLALLKAKPETTQRELSYVLDMRQQSLSELLAKLEDKGYIQRSKSDEDARVVQVSLTDSGREAAPDFSAANKDADVFDSLDAGEREAFEELVDKLIPSLESKLDELGVDVRPPRPPREHGGHEGHRHHGPHDGHRMMGRGHGHGEERMRHHGPDFDPRGERDHGGRGSGRHGFEPDGFMPMHGPRGFHRLGGERFRHRACGGFGHRGFRHHRWN